MTIVSASPAFIVTLVWRWCCCVVLVCAMRCDAMRWARKSLRVSNFVRRGLASTTTKWRRSELSTRTR